jgi:molybdopterin-binding protein
MIQRLPMEGSGVPGFVFWRLSMELSARNQLAGTVKSVKTGGVMAEVVVDVGGQEIVAAITAGSAEKLRLGPGESVVVLIKATEVMIGRD